MNHVITAEELKWLAEKAVKLRELTERVSEDTIEGIGKRDEV